MSKRPTNSDLTPAIEIPIPALQMVDSIANNLTDIIKLSDRLHVTDRRHAELAALVSELTVAVEALERNVTALTERERLRFKWGDVKPEVRQGEGVT